MKNKRLLSAIAGFILLAGFTMVSYMVKKGYFKNFDFSTTVRLQNHISRRFDMPFSLFSLLGSFEFTLAILAGLFLVLLIWKRKIFFGAFLFFLILVVEVLGKIVIYHPGPPYMFFRYALGFAFPSSYIHTNYSYPSGHMARTAFLVVVGIAMILIFIRNKASRLFVVAGLLGVFGTMFLSRVYLGEHWFSDVLGGFLLGSSLALLGVALF